MGKTMSRKRHDNGSDWQHNYYLTLLEKVSVKSLASVLPQPDVMPQDEIDEDLRDLEYKQV